jgi:hypothetical protein
MLTGPPPKFHGTWDILSAETPVASPASISAWRTHLRSVSVFIPSRPAIAFIAAHSES